MYVYIYIYACMYVYATGAVHTPYEPSIHTNERHILTRNKAVTNCNLVVLEYVCMCVCMYVAACRAAAFAHTHHTCSTDTNTKD